MLSLTACCFIHPHSFLIINSIYCSICSQVFPQCHRCHMWIFPQGLTNYKQFFLPRQNSNKSVSFQQMCEISMHAHQSCAGWCLGAQWSHNNMQWHDAKSRNRAMSLHGIFFSKFAANSWIWTSKYGLYFYCKLHILYDWGSKSFCLYNSCRISFSMHSMCMFTHSLYLFITFLACYLLITNT